MTPSEIDQARALAGAGSRTLVLVTTKHREAQGVLGMLLDAAASCPGVHVAIKTHPAETPEVYADLVAGHPNVTVLPASAPLAPLLGASRAVVTVNSTVALDAAVLGVPALVIGLPNNLSPFVEAGIMAGVAGAGAERSAAGTTESCVPWNKSCMMRSLDASWRSRSGVPDPVQHRRRRQGRRAGRGGHRDAGRMTSRLHFRLSLHTSNFKLEHFTVHTSDFRLSSMRVLITGGAGFVGSHLAEALLARGDEVYALDNLSTGSIDNIAHLKSHPKFHYTIDSVMNEPVLAELVDRSDVVVHLAAAVGVKLIVEAPVHTIETNVHGTEVVLKLANKKKKLVVIASTSEVYGKSTDVPFHEDADLVLGPSHKHRWAYACSKLLDEFLALAYWKERKLPVIIVRLFNTVGPRQTGQYGMVVPNFVRQALAGQPITVFGDGRAVTQLHLRRGRRTGCGSLDRRTARRGTGLQHRQRLRDHYRRSGRADSNPRGQPVGDRPDPLRSGV